VRRRIDGKAVAAGEWVGATSTAFMLMAAAITKIQKIFFITDFRETMPAIAL
jgi:hypothetical protein